MNYQIIYNQLITRAKKRNLIDRKKNYFETHHIVPKCLGGSDKKVNKVNLTAREHFLAHWLLHRIYPKNSKLAYAFYRTSHRTSKKGIFKISSVTYEELRTCRFRSKVSNKKQSSSLKKAYNNGLKVWNEGKKHSKNHYCL